VNTHSLAGVILLFRIENGDYYYATLDQVDVTPSGINDARYQLLGMDVTNRFRRFVTERRRPYFEL
jgi:lipase chaperone LimK